MCIRDRTYSESMDCHPGHPRNMMSHEEFCDRFRIEAAPTLDADKIEKTIEALSHLEDCEDCLLYTSRCV